MKLTLEDLGYNSQLENYRKEKNLDSFGVGRIISEHKERYIVKTDEDEFEAEVIGNLRFSAKNRSDFPAVGDWVATSEYEGKKVLIHKIFPRKSIIERTAVGKFGEKQIIATNIDCSFIVQAVERDFNINRIERYLTICYAANVTPIVILTKIDLITNSQLETFLNSVRDRVLQVPIIAISNETQVGYGALYSYLFRGQTYCLLGSSGVGKSTLLNNIAAKSLMKTDSLSQSTKKGKHVTSHRELFVLDNKGIWIDNPGMREVGIADTPGGLENSFKSISNLSQKCKFKNCKHIHESGCAVIQAVDRGDLDKDSYSNYLKMEKERTHFKSTVAEKRKKEKDFGKIIKDYKRFKRENE
jgi:ribosome biogenesis GTPase